jgi:putative transposase
MSWFILKHIFSTLLTIVNVRRLSDQAKDLEILVLRQQLSILQRKLNHPIKPSKIEKLTLAVLTTKFTQTTHQTANQLRDVIRIFQPETVLHWHRDLVRRKWSYPNKNMGGRPPISDEIDSLVLRLARENARFGYGKIVGELLKLGFKVSLTSVRNILNCHRILPAPVRNGSIGLRHLMNYYKEQIPTCDFFPWKPSGCRPSTCSSSLNWVLARFISLVSPPIPIRFWSLHRPGNWFGSFPSENSLCAS